MSPTTVWTASGVRLRVAREGTGFNWLLVPGGPGLGSESLMGLADSMEVRGTVWLVDLPGDGSNLRPEKDPYRDWPGVLQEAADAVDEAVLVGHSTGAMYALSTPGLKGVLAGIVLMSSAPHAGWQSAYELMTAQNPIPEVARAADRFAASRSVDDLRALLIASAPWNFSDGFVAEGRQLFSALLLNVPAMEWSAANFDTSYEAGWWPDSIVTLIISGSDDRIVDQSLWDEPCWTGSNVRRCVIAGGGHFPWVERPDAVARAFADLDALLAERG